MPIPFSLGKVANISVLYPPLLNEGKKEKPDFSELFRVGCYNRSEICINQELEYKKPLSLCIIDDFTGPDKEVWLQLDKMIEFFLGLLIAEGYFVSAPVDNGFTIGSAEL